VFTALRETSLRTGGSRARWSHNREQAAATRIVDPNHAARYYRHVIVSFKSGETEALANGKRVRRFVSIESVARRKIRQLQIANQLEDLRVPPGNRLEKLKGNRAGQYSIRVNDQFRVCFRWTILGAEDVEITDYH
jgi:proteic killer suppression protein